MQVPIRPSSALALLGLVAVATAASAGGDSGYTGAKTPSTQYLFCTAVRSQHELPNETVVPAVAYYSGTFAVKGQDTNAAAKGFLAYLQKKYSFEPDPGQTQPVACTSVHSMEEAQTVEKNYIAKSKQYAGAGKVIETGWVPGSS